MAFIQLKEKADEGSTYIILVTFNDENNAPVIPTSLTWTLFNSVHQIINARDHVAVTPISATVPIVLSGDDLIYAGNGSRIVLVEALYSSSRGSGLSIKKEVGFSIDPLRTVA